MQQHLFSDSEPPLRQQLAAHGMRIAEQRTGMGGVREYLLRGCRQFAGERSRPFAVWKTIEGLQAVLADVETSR